MQFDKFVPVGSLHRLFEDRLRQARRRGSSDYCHYSGECPRDGSRCESIEMMGIGV